MLNTLALIWVARPFCIVDVGVELPVEDHGADGLGRRQLRHRHARLHYLVLVGSLNVDVIKRIQGCIFFSQFDILPHPHFKNLGFSSPKFQSPSPFPH